MFLYHCINLFFILLEIMARLLISPSFYLIVGNIFLIYIL